MYGVIDVGSNTIRLSCYQVREGGLQYVFHKKSMAGLAGYVGKDGKMSEEGIGKLSQVLADLANVTAKLALEGLFVFATASLRNIANPDEVLTRAKEAAGFDIQIITGEEEARLDFLGAMSRRTAEDGLLADIGGGSTELVGFGQEPGVGLVIREAVSVPIGSLNLYAGHVSGILPEDAEFRSMKKEIKKVLKPLALPVPESGLLVGVGGTCRAVRKLYRAKFGGRPETEEALSKDTAEPMEAEKIQELYKWLRDEAEDGVKLLLRVVPDRVHTILPGLTVLCVLLKKYQIGHMEISKWGVREGYLLAQLGKE